MAWQRQDGADYVIEARTVSEAGALGPVIEVARASYIYDFAMASSADGTALVTWTVQSQTGYDLRGARIASDGSLPDAGGFDIAVAPGYQYRPSVAANGTAFLVTWTDGRSNVSYDIYGARVSLAGQVLDPNGIPISTAAGDQTGSAVASDGSGFLVAWTDARGTDTDIYATPVSAGGAVSNVFGVPVSADVGAETLGGAAWAGGAYTLTWDHVTGLGTSEVSAAAVDLEADPAVNVKFTVAAAAGQGPAEPDVAPQGTGSAFVWRDNVSGTAIKQQRFDAARTSVPPGTVTVSFGVNHQERPAVAYNGTNYLAVWFDRRSGDTTADLRASRVQPDGTVLDGGGLLIASNVDIPAANADADVKVVWNGTNYLVAWASGGNIASATVSSGGTVSAPIALASSGLVEKHPSVAAGSGQFLVTWTQVDATGKGDVLSAIVTSAGAISASPTITALSASDERDPVAVYSGGQYYVAYLLSTATVIVKSVSTAGAVSTSFIATTSGGSPFAAADDTSWVLGWTNSFHVAQVVRMSGTSTSGSVAVVNQQTLVFDPQLAYNGGELVLASDTGSDVVVSHLSPTFATLSLDTYAGAADPEIVRGPVATVGLAYSHWTETASVPGANRSFLRTIRRFALEVSPTSISATEGQDETFTVKLYPARNDATVTVHYATTDVFAKSPDDYTATTDGVVTFAPGVTTQTVSIPTIDDTIDENDEDFQFQLKNASNADLSSTNYAVTYVASALILDNDPSPTVAASDVSVDENAGTATLTLVLSAPSQRNASIAATNWGGTATTGADYTYPAFSRIVDFPVGATQATLDIPILDDTTHEGDEYFDIRLAGGTAVTASDEFARVTITDDDPVPTVSVEPKSVTEGNSATTPVAVTVRLSNPTTATATVSVSTSDGTATAPADYGSVSGATVSFSPGQTSKTTSFNVVGDTTDELDETFSAVISSPSNATLGTDTADVTIVDDDGPTLTVGDASDAESAANLTFPLTLSAPTVQDVTGTCATADGTASAGSDYTAHSAPFTIAAGQTQTQVSVDLLQDALDEADETFTLTCTVGSAASLADGVGTGTITDDDASPVVSVGAAQTSEGDSDTHDVNVPVHLSAPSGRAVSVKLSTSDGSATAPGDYTAVTDVVVDFPAGDTEKQVPVAIAGDTLDEPDETFTATLSQAVAATLDSTPATVTILDDDVPVVSVGDASVPEAGGPLSFQISLSAPSPDDVDGTCTTADGTASAGADYVARSTVAFTVPAGQSGKAFTVDVSDDALDEPDETLALTCSVTSNGTLGDNQGTGTIEDDDDAPKLSVDAVQVAEGNSGTVAVAVPVKLSAPSGREVTVHVSTGDMSATAPADYASMSTTLTFAPGETVKTPSVEVAGDTLDEPDETFSVTLSQPTAATLGTSSAAVKILDDDNPALSVLDANAGESAGPLGFKLELSAASPQDVAGTCTTANGTATEGADYVARSGAFLIPAGAGSTTFAVDLLTDTADEPDETVHLTCVVGPTATLADGEAVGTILDDDGPGGTDTSNSRGVAIGAGAIVVDRRGRATVPLSCPAANSGPCRGTLVVKSAKKVRGAAAGKIVTFAKVTYAISPGRTAKIVVRFSKPNLKLLQKLKTVSVVVTAGSARRTTRLRAR